MKKFKDFLYDKNDIIIALCILAVAGLLIVWRIESIMKYPETLAKETNTLQTTEDKAVADSSEDSSGESEGEENSNPDKDKSDKQESDQGQTSNSIWAGDRLAKDVTVTVAGGSAVGAVQSLIYAGLFDSYDDYVAVCNYSGIVPENIKATTFTFRAGSTKTDIAAKVTQ